jgi:hypothetical protein
MPRWLLSVCITCVLTAGQPQSGRGDEKRPPTRAGQWLQHRGDRALTGHCEVPGNITKPAIRWKKFTGHPETLL